MKSYKGIVQIRCDKKKGGCLRNLGNDVQPGCMDCPESRTIILDLEGNSIFEYVSPEERTGERTKKVLTQRRKGAKTD